MTDRNEIARRAFQAGAGHAKEVRLNGFEAGPMVDGGDRRPWRAAIAIVSGHAVKADFAMALGALCFSPGCLIAIVNQKVEDSAGSYDISLNNATELSKAMDVDYIFFLGPDMVVPRDVMRRLIKHEKDIVGATYLRTVEPHGLVVKTLGDQPVDVEHGLAEVEVLPVGCLMVRVEALKKLKRPYFRPVVIEEDVDKQVLPAIAPSYQGFCELARAAGLQVFCDIDLSREVEHVGEAKFKLQQEQPPAEAPVAEPANEPAAATH